MTGQACRAIQVALAGLVMVLLGAVGSPAGACGHAWAGADVARATNQGSAGSGETFTYDRPAQQSAPRTMPSPAADLELLRASSPPAALLAVPTTTGVAAEAGRPAVSDPRLGRALADDFRGGPNPIGDGSALDAARHTVRTGDLVGGSTHLEKAVEMRDRYARSLRRGGLNPADEAVARSRYDAYRTFVDELDLDSMMRARGLR